MQKTESEMKAMFSKWGEHRADHVFEPADTLPQRYSVCINYQPTNYTRAQDILKYGFAEDYTAGVIYKYFNDWSQVRSMVDDVTNDIKHKLCGGSDEVKICKYHIPDIPLPSYNHGERYDAQIMCATVTDGRKCMPDAIVIVYTT